MRVPLISTILNSICSIEDILSLAVSEDDKYIVSGSDGGSIKVFDIETKAVVHHFKEQHTGRVNLYFYYFTCQVESNLLRYQRMVTSLCQAQQTKQSNLLI